MRSDVFPQGFSRQRKSIHQPAQFRAGFIITPPLMDKEKRITHLINDMRKNNRTITAKAVVVASILIKGPAIDISDRELIQSIINKTKES